MRIALDASYSVDPQPSGIAVYSRRILEGLAAAHPECEFLHYYRPKQFRASVPSGRRNVKRRLLLPFSTGRAAEIFHALNQRVDGRMGRQVVSTFHDLFVMTAEYSTPDFRARFSEQARRAAERSDLVIAVSEFTAGQVESLLKVDRKRIRVIPHGVDSPQELGLEREPIVLFVGALQVRKNVARLVRAFEAMPQPWKLVLAGAPSGYGAGDILQQVEASRCRNRIEVTGYLPRAELDKLFARASIFAFPSLDEGFGIPVLEAMAWGVPVVTSRGSALGELASGAALLSDPQNEEELAGAMCQLANSPELQAMLSKLGRERAEGYKWELSVKMTFNAYEEL